MDFSLTDEQRAWQLKARKFAQEELRPISLQRDRIPEPRETFDWEVIKKGSKLGFRTAVVPKEWGGHDIDLLTQALVMAELAKGESAIAKTFSQCWKWTHLICAVCTQEQKERFLKPFVADDTYLLGYAGTEPNAGSDHRLPPDDDLKAGWRLRAERKGDEWILNGEKCFIANGSVGKLFFVGTRTNPSASQKEGTTVFLVPSDTPGLRVGKVFDKSGWRFYQNAELIFENARVPHANLVGEVNGGIKLRGTSHPFGDFELGANALGICDAAVEMAIQYAQTSWPNAKYFIDNQTIQLKLSEMRMLTESLRSFVMRIAAEGSAMRLAAAGATRTGHYASFLQNFGTDIVQRVTLLNLDIHGSAGVMTMDAHAEKLVRDAIIWTHNVGDSVQRMRAIRQNLGITGAAAREGLSTLTSGR
jgi:acyl-CoA dehydrogenase